MKSNTVKIEIQYSQNEMFFRACEMRYQLDIRQHTVLATPKVETSITAITAPFTVMYLRYSTLRNPVRTYLTRGMRKVFTYYLLPPSTPEGIV